MAKHKILLCPIDGCNKRVRDCNLKVHLKFAHKIEDPQKIEELLKNAIVVGEEDIIVSPKQRAKLMEQERMEDDGAVIKIPFPDISFPKETLVMLAVHGVQMGYLDMKSFIKREIIPLLNVKKDIESIIGIKISPVAFKQIMTIILNNPEILSKIVKGETEK